MSRFFSDEAYEPQVDPFNAGEPVMPWDDSNALHDDACKLPANSRYTAEKKPKDDYRAPERPAARRKEQAAGVAGEKHAGSPGAQRLFRRTFALVVTVSVLLSIFGSCASVVFDSDTEDTSNSDDAALGYSEGQMDTDEQAIADAVSARMDGIADDPDVIDMAKRGLDEKLKSYVGYTAEELGIDADAYAAWFLSQVSYQTAYAYSYDDGSGSASVDITAPVAYRIASDFYDKANDYLMSNKLYGSFEDGVAAGPLTPEQQDQMRGFFADVLAATEPDDSGYMNVAASKGPDGAWRLNEEDIQSELSYLFGIQ